MVYPLKLILLVFGFATTVGLMLILAWSLQRASIESLSKQIGRILAMSADQIHDKIDILVLERLQDLSAVAALVGPERSSRENAASELLAQSVNGNPEFAWVGYLAGNGSVISSVGDQAVGQRVLNAPWMRSITTVGATLPGLALLTDDRSPLDASPAQLTIGLAVPVRDRSGTATAFVVAGWNWAGAIKPFLSPSRLGLDDTDALILSPAGHVLLGPPDLARDYSPAQSFTRARKEGNGSVVEMGSAGGQYLVGFSRSKTSRLSGDLGLTVLVRQDASVALAPIAELKRSIWLLLAFFAFHAFAFNWFVAAKLSRPLLTLASAANTLRRSESANIPRLTQFAEVEVLSESLISLVAQLKERQNSLIALSASLEATVKERTSALEERNRSLADATDRAERATEAKSRLLAAASHDLRQPLHALSLFCLALKRRASGSEIEGLVGKLEQSLYSLNTMLDKLLHIARLDAGLVTRKIAPVRVKDLIRRIGAEFAVDADQRGLHFDFTSVDCHVLTDAPLLETIVRNLLSNAFKFTADGGVLLAARSRGSQVPVEVYDTGPGIESSQLGRIFNEFERSASHATGPNEGLGLGLSIVQRHAELIGAVVSVRSTVGHGSRFSIALRKVEAPAIAKPPHDTPVGASPIEGVAILLLDDNAKALDALAQDLEDRGAAVIAFDRPSSALAALRDGLEADVAVVDYDFGGRVTGIDFLEQCRRDGRDFAALILTGRTDDLTLKSIARSGILCLTKPADPELLAVAIGRLARSAAPPARQPELIG
jgi:signal transduction histidine kinase/CheY-like chemotaxis protein